MTRCDNRLYADALRRVPPRRLAYATNATCTAESPERKSTCRLATPVVSTFGKAPGGDRDEDDFGRAEARKQGRMMDLGMRRGIMPRCGYARLKLS